MAMINYKTYPRTQQLDNYPLGVDLDIDQSTIIKWVAVPAVTVGALLILRRVIGKKRRKK